jgi:chromosome segregation ATPase
MKPLPRLLCLSAACAAFALRLFSAPPAPDALRERYVAGLGVIADAQATVARTGRMLDLIESGADAQANRASLMESRLLNTRHQADSFDRQIQALAAQTTRLLEQKRRIETRFGTLDRTLGDDRALLAKSTEIAGALVASAEKSGSYVERTIAENVTGELKQHARQLRDLVDRLAQARQRLGLEWTLFDGLQPRLAASAADLKTLNAELAAASGKVEKLRASLNELRAALERDHAGLTKQHQAFGVSVEGFRLVQADVLRRWLLDGPPAGDLPPLSIDDIVESGLHDASEDGDTGARYGASVASPAAVGDATTQMDPMSVSMQEAEQNNQISPEFTQLNRRARWLLAMLTRLEVFATLSLHEAEQWNHSASQWRSQLTNLNRSVADQRGQLSSLQMEQDMVATTIKLIGQQASDTTGTVAAAVKHLGTQAEKLAQLTAELKRLSAN